MKRLRLLIVFTITLLLLSACGHTKTKDQTTDKFMSYRSELHSFEEEFETVLYVSTQDQANFEAQVSQAKETIQTKHEEQTLTQLNELKLDLKTLKDQSNQISTSLSDINYLLSNPYLDETNKQRLETLYAKDDHFESFDAFSKELETAFQAGLKSANKAAQAAKDAALNEAKPWLSHESMPHRDKARLEFEIEAVEQASVDSPSGLQAAIDKLQEVLEETSTEAERIQKVNEENLAKESAESESKAKLPKLSLTQVQAVANDAVNDTAKNADSALWSLQQNTSSDILIYWITVDGDDVFDPSIVDTDYIVREVYSVEDLGNGKFRVEFIIDAY
jgi:SOS-response transcriptional repressor LexA